MLLKFPIILSSNSFLFHLLFPFLFFFVDVLSKNQVVYNDTTYVHYDNNTFMFIVYIFVLTWWTLFRSSIHQETWW